MLYPLKTMNFFYFPLKIVSIDDDPEYLKITSTYLDKNLTSTYSQPSQLLLNLKPIKINVKDLLTENFIGVFDINYDKLESLLKIYKSQDGILVSDYQMPELDGIKLISNFRNTNLVTILLTNIFTSEEAINALNEKIINYYLPKNKIHKLPEIINQLQANFFSELTQKLLEILDKHEFSFISDNNYIEICNNVFKEFNISSYRILNNGCYYIENDFEKFILSIYKIDFLNEISKEYPTEVAIKLKSGTFIPLYVKNSDSHNDLIEAKKIGNYSYAVQKINN